MDSFFKAVSAILIGVILFQLLSKRDKDLALLLSILICAMTAITAAFFLEPVMDFIQQLRSAAKLDNQMLEIILKAVGIGILSEIAGNVCSDAGNVTLAKMLQFLATAVILWLSLPLFTGLLELLQNILGEI